MRAVRSISDISRALLVAAVSDEQSKLRVPPHTANCVVEQDGKLEKVTAVLAPKIIFKDGRADKVWVNLKSVEGPPSIRLTLQTAAQLADTLGLFHKQMIKAINRYIERHCPTTQSVAASTPPPKAAKRDAERQEWRLNTLLWRASKRSCTGAGRPRPSNRPIVAVPASNGLSRRSE